MSGDGARKAIRHPAVAGKFYPADPDELREALEQAFLPPLGPGKVPTVAADGPRKLTGIVAPHAGYVFSAAGAAWAYAELARDGRPSAAVIMGVNHYGFGAPIALSSAAGWATPLGVMPVAGEVQERLRALERAVVYDDNAHVYEHSLEVHVPFLQFLYGELPIVPIAVGTAPVSAVVKLGEALAALAREGDLCIIASTDFSHMVTHEEAKRLDALALERIAAVDAEGLVKVVHEQGITMCGALPVAALLAAARALDVRTGRVLHYHTSGDVTGDRYRVVGYGAAAL